MNELVETVPLWWQKVMDVFRRVQSKYNLHDTFESHLLNCS